MNGLANNVQLRLEIVDELVQPVQNDVFDAGIERDAHVLQAQISRFLLVLNLQT